jgi:AcrR family transcriptional regulator
MSDRLYEAKAVQRRERSDATQNRQRLLTVARQLFAEQGVEATSMNEIAQIARLGSGTLYRHFAHKGELCEALLMEDIPAFWERIDTALAHRGESALNQLGWLIDELLHLIESHLPLLAAIQWPQGSSEYYRSSVYYQGPFYGILHAHLRSLLERAVEQGEAVDLNIAFTADAIYAAIAPPLFLFQRTGRQFSLEQISTGMRRLFVDGLRVHAEEH